MGNVGNVHDLKHSCRRHGLPSGGFYGQVYRCDQCGRPWRWAAGAFDHDWHPVRWWHFRCRRLLALTDGDGA